MVVCLKHTGGLEIGLITLKRYYLSERNRVEPESVIGPPVTDRKIVHLTK
jgi:hypothetical protein